LGTANIGFGGGFTASQSAVCVVASIGCICCLLYALRFPPYLLGGLLERYDGQQNTVWVSIEKFENSDVLLLSSAGLNLICLTSLRDKIITDASE
jgi:hypothetical protein